MEYNKNQEIIWLASGTIRNFKRVAAFLAKLGNFDEKPGVTVEISPKQAGNGDHGTIGGVMETAKLVPISGFGRNGFS